MRRILVVDDEPELAAAIHDAILQELPDAHVETTGDPRTAIEMARANPPDLLLSDYHMPGMTGMQLLETLRAEFPDLKSILITAAPTPGLAREAQKRAGTQLLFIKPFDAEALTRAVEHLTRTG